MGGAGLLLVLLLVYSRGRLVSPSLALTRQFANVVEQQEEEAAAVSMMMRSVQKQVCTRGSV